MEITLVIRLISVLLVISLLEIVMLQVISGRLNVKLLVLRSYEAVDQTVVCDNTLYIAAFLTCGLNGRTKLAT